MRNLLWLTALTVCAGLPSLVHGQWYGSVDFLAPTRSTPNNVFQRNIVATTTGTGANAVTTLSVGSQTTLSADDLGFVAAGRATLGFRPGIVGVEGSVLATDRWHTYNSVFDPNGRLASPFSPVGTVLNANAPGFDFNTFASVDYTTDLQLAELNLTWLLYSDVDGEATCKFGLRGMSIEEQLNYLSTRNGAQTASLLFTTSNRMIGPQLGLEGYAYIPGGMIGLNCLGGIAYNEVDRTEVFNGTTTILNTTEGAIFGELGIEYVFTPTDYFAIRFGYKGLGISDVALALDSPLVTNNQTSSVWYSLPYIGVTWSY